VFCHVATVGVFFATEAVFNKYEQPYQNSDYSLASPCVSNQTVHFCQSLTA